MKITTTLNLKYLYLLVPVERDPRNVEVIERKLYCKGSMVACKDICCDFIGEFCLFYFRSIESVVPIWASVSQ